MAAPEEIRVHVERIRGTSPDDMMSRVLQLALHATPRARPVTMQAGDELAGIGASCTRAVLGTGRSMAGPSPETVALRTGVAAGPLLRIPARWVGSTLVLVQPLSTQAPAPTADALLRLARAAGARGSTRNVARVGTWLATHVFAAVVVVVLAPGRAAAAQLPRHPRAHAALDAWLAGRVGHARPVPHGLVVRCAEAPHRGPWQHARLLERRLSLATTARVRR